MCTSVCCKQKQRNKFCPLRGCLGSWEADLSYSSLRPVKQQSKESRKSISTKAYVIQLGGLDSKQTGYEIKKIHFLPVYTMYNINEK